jgi:uracil-DNA glycosylase
MVNRAQKYMALNKNQNNRTMTEVSEKNVQIEPGWKTALAGEFSKPYFAEIKAALQEAKQGGKVVYPAGPLIFNAFNLTPWQDVKVVILGQDPYHNPGEAMGLSFSVPKGVRIPPSLRNIYREIVQDLGIPAPTHGDLSGWAKQGVLLLNAMLTVEHNSPASHKDLGWQTFTDAVIRTLSEQKSGVIFLLWGRFAQGKKDLIDRKKHLVLEAAHPSPLARDAFMGCKHFSLTNEALKQQGKNPINWDVNA